MRRLFYVFKYFCGRIIRLAVRKIPVKRAAVAIDNRRNVITCFYSSLDFKTRDARVYKFIEVLYHVHVLAVENIGSALVFLDGKLVVAMHSP